MPVKNDPNSLRALINRKVADNKLTPCEAREIAARALRDGVTAEEGAAIVESFVALFEKDGLDWSKPERVEAFNAALGQIDAAHALPLDKTGATQLPGGGIDFHKLFQQQGGFQPTSAKSLQGWAIGMNKAGEVSLDGRRVNLELSHPSDATLEVLWGLARPGANGIAGTGDSLALQRKLAAALTTAAAVNPQDPDKFKRIAALCAATTALGEVAAQWTPETIDAMLAFAENSPSPMIKALALRGLDAAPLSDAQKQKRAALGEVEGGADLLKGFDEMRTGQARAGWRPVEGAAAELGLSAYAFASSKDAFTNFLDVMKAWDALNPGYNESFNAEEITRLREIMIDYAQTSEQTSFVFGTLKSNAPKDVAAVVSARTFAAIEPQLKADPPSLNGQSLTREQADFILKIGPNVRDEAAVKQMLACLNLAQAMFEPRMPGSWETPTRRDRIDPAAFELFQRVATDYQDRLSAKPDGKLEYSDLLSEMRAEVGEIHAAVAPRLAELAKTPPTWDGVQLSPEAASYLEGQLKSHLKSTMSVDNLGRALKVWAEKNGGKVAGASFESFRAMVEEYKGNWPDLKTFDFNKLERIASFKVEGKEVPLCTLNGKPVGLADFYDSVATSVTEAFDRSKLRQPWMADRWGYRAKQLVELMDVVAEQAARGEGPVALLAKDNPGRRIEILATGADGGHAQLLYSVKDSSGRELSRWSQGSDGALAQHRELVEPILFTATVGASGDLNVKVAPSISTTRFPLQNPYTVGDRVDVTYYDSSVVEMEVEGKPFATRYKVLEAEITGYDARGNYTLKYTTPDGTEKIETVPLSTIRKANNPHYFNPTGDSFSDVTININTDAELKAFLEGARPIIEAHLPTDGSVARMSPKELARRQKACIDALQQYCSRIKYPQTEGTITDPASLKYKELEDSCRFPLGELAKIDRGVCRHQCIFQHLLLQAAGIDSRLASGAANTSSNAFRGFHIWNEVTLADNERYLSDQTWSDSYIPLWKGAYSVDKQRAEMYDRTARYDRNIVN